MVECDRSYAENVASPRGFLGFALWPNGIGPIAGVIAAWGALAVVHAATTVLIGVVAIFIIVAGFLIAADWRADLPSRQAWAEIDVAVAVLGLPSDVALPWPIDPRYALAIDNPAMRMVFRAHRLAAPTSAPKAAGKPPTVARGVPAHDELVTTKSVPSMLGNQAPRAAVAAGRVTSGRATLRPDPAEVVAIVALSRRSRLALRAERAASRTRLVANGGKWYGRSEPSASFTSRGPSTRIIVGSIGPDQDPHERDRQRTVIDRSPTSDLGATVASTSARASAAPQRRVNSTPADPIVVDDFGERMPIAEAELRVIETYLDQALRDLLAPRGADQDGQMS